MKRVIFFALLLIVACTGAFAQSRQVDFSIRFFDKTIYEPETPIRIKIMLRNDSGSTYRFRLAEDRVFNVDFDVVDTTNTPVSESEALVRQRTASRQVFYREVVIQPGEEFSFVEDLTDYVEIPGPGLYVVSARFFPGLFTQNGGDPLQSNRLTLSVRPQTDSVESAMPSVQVETQRRLEQQPIPPDDVVEYTIEARQQGQWNRFFLYLDLESLLRASPNRERRFVQLSESEQEEALQQFREELRAEQTEDAILVIPDEFTMVRTSYTQNEAEVVVDLRFEYDNYAEVRRYTYFLERRDSVWMITDYTVTNLGTEQR